MRCALPSMGARRPELGTAAVLVLAPLLLGLQHLAAPVLSLDEQSNLVYADQVAAGRLPHRDFFATYGPANYWLIALGYVMAGAGVEAERAVALAYTVALGAAVYVAARSRGRAMALAAALMSQVMCSALGTIAYAWVGGIAVVTASLAILQRARSDRAVALAGFVGTSCAWWRLEMLPIALVVALPFLVPVGRRSLAYLLGAAVNVLGIAVYVARAPAWIANVFGRLGVDAGFATLDPLVVLAGAVIAMLGAAMVVLGVRRRDPSCLSIAGLVFLAMPQLIQRPDVAHLTFVGCASVPLAVAFVLDPATAERSAVAEGCPPLPRRIGRLWLSACMALTAVAGLAGALSFHRSDVVRLSLHDRSLLVASGDAPSIVESVEALEAAAHGGPVFIGAADMAQPTLTWAMLYHLVPDRQVTAYYLEIPPGLDGRQERRLVADIEGADALLLTPFSDANRERLFPRVDDLSQAPNDAVREHFCLRSSAPMGTVWSAC